MGVTVLAPQPSWTGKRWFCLLRDASQRELLRRLPRRRRPGSAGCAYLPSGFHRAQNHHL